MISSACPPPLSPDHLLVAAASQPQTVNGFQSSQSLRQHISNSETGLTSRQGKGCHSGSATQAELAINKSQCTSLEVISDGGDCEFVTGTVVIRQPQCHRHHHHHYRQYQNHWHHQEQQQQQQQQQEQQRKREGQQERQQQKRQQQQERKQRQPNLHDHYGRQLRDHTLATFQTLHSGPRFERNINNSARLLDSDSSLSSSSSQLNICPQLNSLDRLAGPIHSHSTNHPQPTEGDPSSPYHFSHPLSTRLQSHNSHYPQSSTLSRADLVHSRSPVPSAIFSAAHRSPPPRRFFTQPTTSTSDPLTVSSSLMCHSSVFSLVNSMVTAASSSSVQAPNKFSLKSPHLPLSPTHVPNINVSPSPSPLQPLSMQLPTVLNSVVEHSPHIHSHASRSSLASPSSGILRSAPNHVLSTNVHQQQVPNRDQRITSAAAVAAAAFYPQLMCLPAFLDRFGHQILRSSINPTHFKPIPNNERVDLMRFRAKRPQDWTMEDVIAWILDVAKRNRIPFEDLEMQKFANSTGASLLLMDEQTFKERDLKYGSMLYSELQTLIADSNKEDEWTRTEKNLDGNVQSPMNFVFDSATRTFSSSTSTLNDSTPLQSGSKRKIPNYSAISVASKQNAVSFLDLRRLVSHANVDADGTVKDNVSVLSADISLKIKRNKDGRPRKRSHHVRGNKLWEFIRDALNDRSTCPSIVKWEDAREGVFRIVESEKLARLWGEKKNNHKMTYEKLSRAMRTYYEKQILVPVPKTGLYPKKLVYKFGPSAHGWNSLPNIRIEHCS